MKAALLVAHDTPLAISEVTPGPLSFGQVLVRVQASGLCGAQLQEIRGEKGGPLPHLLGHEGCGIVEEIGDCVTRVKKGDKVVIHWRKAAGIESPIPEYWAEVPGGKLKIPITSGRCVSLAEEVICSENRLTPVPLDTPRELCALLGCSLSTALATIERDAAVRAGERVMVVGCGGLGVNLIRAARLAHAGEIYATDIHERKKPVARAMGADHFSVGLEHAPGRRCDCIIDTVGSPESVEASFPHLAPSGRYVLVGQPRPGATLSFPNARQLFDGEGQTIRATQGGGFRPDLDIPRYLEMHRRGDLKLTGLISHYLPLSKINRAIEHLKDGEASRILIEMGN
jgi:S-(hydroxymethyl)glutathione dehydrogenase/alcohol dehydrogenase